MLMKREKKKKATDAVENDTNQLTSDKNNSFSSCSYDSFLFFLFLRAYLSIRREVSACWVTFTHSNDYKSSGDS